MSADKLVATPVKLDVQLNDTFSDYQVGVAVSVLDPRTSPADVVSRRRRPIKWADCIHPRFARTFNICDAIMMQYEL